MAVLDLLFLLAGFVLLVAGASGVVQGGSALARRIGISPLWVGLTIVSLGTTSPEIVVSVTAAVQGRPEVAFGNIVGSVILNLLLILGVATLVRPFSVKRVMVRRDLLVLLGVAAAVLLVSLDGVLLWRAGVLLLLGFVFYTVYVYRAEKRGWKPVREPASVLDGIHPLLLAGVLAAGLAALLGGAQLALTGAVGLAERFGISDRVIGLTILALGTSLPELATAVVAVLRRQADIALGNIVGANILNLLLVLGTVALITDVPVPALGIRLDLPVMLGAVVLVILLTWTRHRLTRWEGGLMVAAYCAYATALFVLA